MYVILNICLMASIAVYNITDTNAFIKCIFVNE